MILEKKELKKKKNWLFQLLNELSKLLFNRIFYVAVALLIQLGWILLMAWRLVVFQLYFNCCKLSLCSCGSLDCKQKDQSIL